MVEHALQRVARLPLPDHARLTPRLQVHLTLQFIGDTAAANLDAVIESVRRAAGGIEAFELTLQRLITLPQRGPTRLIAIETNAPASLVELQKRLATRLANTARGRPGRDFRPHITVCRLTSPTSRFHIDETASAITGSFPVRRIALMRSTLSNIGATHHELAAVTLGEIQR